jgi:cell division protein FtsB
VIVNTGRSLPQAGARLSPTNRGCVTDRRRSASASLRRRRSKRLCAVLLVLLAGYLYAGPVRSYLDASARTTSDRRQLAQLRQTNANLNATLRSLSTPAKLAEVARGDGYIVPGETPYSLQFAQHTSR